MGADHQGNNTTHQTREEESAEIITVSLSFYIVDVYLFAQIMDTVVVVRFASTATVRMH
jgi:hypothetical protein